MLSGFFNSPRAILNRFVVHLALARLSKSDGIGPHSHIFGWAPAKKSAERQSES